jgi:hypothetical protein
MGVEPETLVLHFHPSAISAGYAAFDGCVLRCTGNHPSRAALESRWATFSGVYTADIGVGVRKSPMECRLCIPHQIETPAGQTYSDALKSGGLGSVLLSTWQAGLKCIEKVPVPYWVHQLA